MNFGQESCRAESKTPGKIVILGIMQGTAAEHQKLFAMVKKINAKRAITLQGGIGKPLDDAGVKQFVQLAMGALNKLP